jgi:hypothetical protein
LTGKRDAQAAAFLQPEGEKIAYVIFVASRPEYVELPEIGQALSIKRLREAGDNSAAFFKYSVELVLVIMKPIHRLVSCQQVIFLRKLGRKWLFVMIIVLQLTNFNQKMEGESIVACRAVRMYHLRYKEAPE